MAIRNKEEKDSGIEIDLTGPEGNAFVLLGYAKQFCRTLRYNEEKTERILDDHCLKTIGNLAWPGQRIIL